MAKINWSTYQNEIFNYLMNEKDSLCIDAKAGSGKTATIVEGACRLASVNPSLRIAFVCFNSSIQKELAMKFEKRGVQSVKCMTLHSCGLSALRKYFGNKKVEVDKKSQKYRSITEQDPIIEAITDANNKRLVINSINKLFDLCRINMVEPSDFQSIDNIAEHHNIDTNESYNEVISRLLVESRKVVAKVDFTDMLCQPTLNQAIRKNADKYDIVFVDECQDLSAAQREVLSMSIADGGRFVAVGDPKQAINGFAGAGVDSFQLLANMANNNVLPLSVCYRCGKNIIKEAQNVVADIVANDSAIDGEVRTEKGLANVQVGDMILCRKSAPLISVALRLIANGNSAYVKGKDLCEGLQAMIRKAKAKTICELFDNLDKQKEEIANRLMKRGFKGDLRNAPSMLAFKDKVECLEIVAEQCTEIGEIVEKLNKLFDDIDNGNAITLSTIHKAKGLEADNVFIIAPECLPLTYKGQQAWEFEQEINLKYVAITRAKKVLTYVSCAEDRLANVEVPNRR